MAKKAVIIGAGPAGLTAGLELLRRTEIVPVILEASGEIGGISRTIRYKGNRMDIGGHRFFSKSDRVMQWWMELMPPDLSVPGEAGPECGCERETTAPGAPGQPAEISYQGKRRVVTVPAHLHEEPPLRGLGPLHHTESAAAEDDSEEDSAEEVAETVAVPEPENPDLVMLIRPRRSRIYYLRKFFDYPITLTANTLKNLGVVRMVRVGTSYAVSRVRQIRPEKSLEDFLINRFGRELYLTFFKSYTEKVWGTPCHEISAEWGAQRIKGLLADHRGEAFREEDVSREERGRRPGPEGDRHLADRALHVPEVRPRPAMGARRRPHPAEGRRDPHGLEGGADSTSRRVGRCESLRSRRCARTASAGPLPAIISSPPCPCAICCARCRRRSLRMFLRSAMDCSTATSSPLACWWTG